MENPKNKEELPRTPAVPQRKTPVKELTLRSGDFLHQTEPLEPVKQCFAYCCIPSVESELGHGMHSINIVSRHCGFFFFFKTMTEDKTSVQKRSVFGDQNDIGIFIYKLTQWDFSACH